MKILILFILVSIFGAFQTVSGAAPKKCKDIIADKIKEINKLKINSKAKDDREKNENKRKEKSSVDYCGCNSSINGFAKHPNKSKPKDCLKLNDFKKYCGNAKGNIKGCTQSGGSSGKVKYKNKDYQNKGWLVGQKEACIPFGYTNVDQKKNVEKQGKKCVCPNGYEWDDKVFTWIPGKRGKCIEKEIYPTSQVWIQEGDRQIFYSNSNKCPKGHGKINRGKVPLYTLKGNGERGIYTIRDEKGKMVKATSYLCYCPSANLVSKNKKCVWEKWSDYYVSRPTSPIKGNKNYRWCKGELFLGTNKILEMVRMVKMKKAAVFGGGNDARIKARKSIHDCIKQVLSGKKSGTNKCAKMKEWKVFLKNLHPTDIRRKMCKKGTDFSIKITGGKRCKESPWISPGYRGLASVTGLKYPLFCK